MSSQSNWIVQIDIRDLLFEDIEEIESTLHAVMSGQVNPWDYSIATFEE
jgi:hypothetical protein